jgi:hypothetical protein
MLGNSHKEDISPSALAAMREAFLKWWGENSGALEDGDVGDVQELVSSLKSAAATKASSSDLEAPSAF